MMFCEECGSLMLPKKDKTKSKMVCSRCGHIKQDAEVTVFREKGTETKEVEVVKENDNQNLPTTEEECPKCGHNIAYYWFLQTRAADEAETRFLKCEKCGHTWREYD